MNRYPHKHIITNYLATGRQVLTLLVWTFYYRLLFDHVGGHCGHNWPLEITCYKHCQKHFCQLQTHQFTLGSCQWYKGDNSRHILLVYHPFVALVIANRALLAYYSVGSSHFWALVLPNILSPFCFSSQTHVFRIVRMDYD